MKTLLVFIVLLFSAICVNAQFSQTVGNITYYGVKNNEDAEANNQ